MHPPTALCVRLYLGIEKPGEKPGRPEPVTEEEVDRLGALLGMRKG